MRIEQTYRPDGILVIKPLEHNQRLPEKARLEMTGSKACLVDATGQQTALGMIPAGYTLTTLDQYEAVFKNPSMTGRPKPGPYERWKLKKNTPMSYLVIDTETNGKAKSFKAPMTDLENWPRVTQLGYAVYDEAGNIVLQKQSLVKPDGWEVPREKFFIDNNMSTERCEREGRPMAEVLIDFVLDIRDCHYMIAHNMQFDYNVLGAEMLRHGVRTGKRLTRICTMEAATRYCALPGYKGYKYPSLAELHKKLFSSTFEGAHDAMADVLACGKCFFELKERGVIKINHGAFI